MNVHTKMCLTITILVERKANKLSLLITGITVKERILSHGVHSEFNFVI